MHGGHGGSKGFPDVIVGWCVRQATTGTPRKRALWGEFPACILGRAQETPDAESQDSYGELIEMSTRDLMKLPAVALLALAAACGGGSQDSADTAATSGDAAAASNVDATSTQSPAAAEATPPAPAAGGNVVEIKMVTTQGGASGTFEPANVTVKQGDVIRWVMADGSAAHNVSFSMAQGNPSGFSAPADSPYLSASGQTFEVKVDNWAAGTYNYVCVPHQGMGMKGTITVQ
jgi:plastocyanin